MNVRIKWSTLLPTTLAASIVALLAISFAATQSSATSTEICGAYPGPLCSKSCTQPCPVPHRDYPCCAWEYQYYDIIH